MSIYELDKYESYKDSEIDWIGEIPEHWTISRVKEFSVIINGATPKSSVEENWEGDINWVTTDDLGKISSKYIVDTKRKLSFVGYMSCGTTVCPIGSVIISGRAPIGHVGILLIKACCNQGCKILVLNNKRINNFFLYYCLLSSKLKLEALGRGTTFIELSTKELGLYNLSIPSLNEQTVIVNYLDTKTTQIDRKIELLTQKASKYEELKKSLINEAVTRGLDETVIMKCSGVEWIGEVPEHWDVKRLKNIAKIKTGGRDTIDNVENGLYPFYVRSQTIERINSYSFNGEAILTAGDGVGVGKVFHYVNEKFDYHQRVYKVSHFKGVLGKFLFYYMRENFYKDALRLNVKATVDSLRMPMLENFSVAFGSVDEQYAIVEYL